MAKTQLEKTIDILKKEKINYAEWQKRRYPVKAERPPANLKSNVNTLFK